MPLFTVMPNNALTDKSYWSERWGRVKLPAVLDKNSNKFIDQEFLRLFRNLLPKEDGLSILEIGGAPGTFLAYFAEEFKYKASALEYTEIGCQKLQENFDLLDLDISIFRKDILDDLVELPRFDIVYSMGFIEHFSNYETVIKRHLTLLKEGGILLLGVPNFAGFLRILLPYFSPEFRKTVNLGAMDIRNWDFISKKLELEQIFVGYVGGLNLHNYLRCERKTIVKRITIGPLKAINDTLTKFRLLRQINSIHCSPYALGVYKKKRHP